MKTKTEQELFILSDKIIKRERARIIKIMQKKAKKHDSVRIYDFVDDMAQAINR